MENLYISISRQDDMDIKKVGVQSELPAFINDFTTHFLGLHLPFEAPSSLRSHQKSVDGYCSRACRRSAI